MRRATVKPKSTLSPVQHDSYARSIGFWDTRFQPGDRPGEPWRAISYISPRFKQFLGYNQEDPLTYEDWKALIHPEDVPTVFRAIDEHTRHRKPYDLEYSMRTKSGEYRRFHVRGQAVWDEEGNKVRMAGWLQEVTEAKRSGKSAPAPVEQQEQMLARMARVGIFQADKDGRFLFMDSSLRDIMGIGESARLPQDWTRLAHESDGAGLRREWQRAIASRAPFHKEFRICAGDGNIRNVIVQAEPQTNEGGKVVSYMGTLVDVTDITRREQRLRETVVALEDRVTEFMGEMERVNETLRKQTNEMQETNIALRVLMKRKSEEESIAEERMLMNLKEMVLPFLEKLRFNCRAGNQVTLIDAIEQNLHDVTSPLLSRLSSRFIGLTQQELRVAKLVRDGKLTKEIASLLNISENVVKTHRAHIRQKLNLNRKKMNLREMLQKLSDK